jgi:hypothetical protein
MTNVQLLQAILFPTAIPTMTILIAMAQNKQRFERIDSRLIAVREKIRSFQRDLGRHDAEIGNLKPRGR